MTGDLFLTSDGKIHQVAEFGFDVIDEIDEDDENVLAEIGKCK